MPKRVDDPPDMVTINVSIPKSLKAECLMAKNLGALKYMAESSFIRYLLELGLRKYQKDYLPGEVPIPSPLFAAFQRADVWVNEALELYNFGIIGGMGSQATVEKQQAKAEQSGYKRMPYYQYEEECLRRFGEYPPTIPTQPDEISGEKEEKSD